MDELPKLELEIRDNTIEHPLPPLESIRSVIQRKRYGAIVWRDWTATGGLGCKLLQTRENGRIVFVDIVQQGNFLELTTKVEVDTKSGRQVDNHFYKVLKKTKSTLILQEVEKEEIPPLRMQSPESENPYSGGNRQTLQGLLLLLTEIEPKLEADLDRQLGCRIEIDKLREVLGMD